MKIMLAHSDCCVYTFTGRMLGMRRYLPWAPVDHTIFLKGSKKTRLRKVHSINSVL